MAFSRFTAGSRRTRQATGGFLAPLLPTLMGLLACLPAFAQSNSALPPGVGPCVTNAIPAGYGTLVMLSAVSYRQTADATPTESATPSPTLIAEIESPDAFMISNALLANTKGFSLALTSGGSGRSVGITNFASEATLLAALPAGTWNTSFQLAFTNGETFVGFSVFNLASNLPPIPQITGFAGAQSIDSTAPYTLNWTPWVGSTTNDRISLVITDPSGTEVITAATDCSSSTELPVGATGFTIPAGRLAAGTTYTGYLTFGASRLAEVDPGALLLQRKFHARTTRFTLATTSSGGGQPGTLSRPTVTPSALLMTLSGVPGTTYAVQASTDLLAWAEQTRATIPASGSTEVTLPLPPANTPRFYRAVAVGGGGTPGAGATLAISASSPTRMRITVQGAAGSTHIVESSTNWVSWAEIGTVTIPEGSTNVAFTTSFPAGTRFAVFRARSDEVAPPPTGKRPTLVATATPTGLRIDLSGGDPNRTYVLQQASSSLASWTATTFTVTTGATGAGQILVAPLPSTSGIFRVEAR